MQFSSPFFLLTRIYPLPALALVSLVVISEVLAFPLIFFFFFFFLLLAVLGLHCCPGFPLVAESRGHSVVLVLRLLTAVVSLLQSMGSMASRLQ